MCLAKLGRGQKAKGRMDIWELKRCGSGVWHYWKCSIVFLCGCGGGFVSLQPFSKSLYFFLTF
jgi:hypothetical protein